MTKSTENIDELFWEHYYSLDEETIIEINNRNFSGEINNVVVGINRHCYAL
jgi:hypothetical protein